jgi:predicted acetyltransferase
MPEVSIRQLQGEEIKDIFHWLVMYAFAPTPPMPDKEKWWERASKRQDSTYMVLFEDDKPMACTIHTEMMQNVRGKLYRMGGVWWVAAHPAARRKGYTRKLLVEEFVAMRKEGHIVSSLYPFRESFYERLGYVTFPQEHIITFDPAPLAPLLKIDLGGTIELMPIEEGRDVYLDYLHKHQPKTHGMAVNVGRTGQMKNFWLALAKVDGETVGAMIYKHTGEMIDFTMTVHRFFYDDSRAKYILLEWIARHIDQAGTIEMKLPQAEMAETWMSDININVRGSSFIDKLRITAMGRVLDVAALGGMQTGPGCFSARISDPYCSWNDGCFQFETVEGVLKVTPTDSADLDLTIQALSGLIYGTHNPDDFCFRGWGSPSPDMQQVMGQMFPRMIPYLHEEF